VIFGTVPGDLMLALQAGARSRHATINGVLAAALLESVRETLGHLPLCAGNPHRQHARTRHSAKSGGLLCVEHRNATPTTYALVVFGARRRAPPSSYTVRLDRGDAAAACLRHAARWLPRWLRCGVQRMTRERQAASVHSISRNRGVTSDCRQAPSGWRLGYPATSNHTFGNGVQVSCATVGQTFFFGLMYVTPLLTVASARRIADGFLECLVRVARNCLQNAILSAIIEFDREQGVALSRRTDRGAGCGTGEGQRA